MDCYGDQIYFYVNNNIIVLNLSGQILGKIVIPKSGESEGLTIAGDHSTVNITIGYNNPNRLYALRTIENSVEYHSLHPGVSINQSGNSNIPLIPKFLTLALNNNKGYWDLVEWENGTNIKSFIDSVVENTTTNDRIEVFFKQAFKSIGYFSCQHNHLLAAEGINVTMNVRSDGLSAVFLFKKNDGSNADIHQCPSGSTVNMLIIGGMSVDD